jgi:hypothetical protein
MNLKATISPRYRGPILVGGCFQVALFFLGLLAMDRGQLLEWTAFAAFTYWLMALLIISRRPQMPTKWDLILLSSGFVLILPVTILLTSLIWSWRGLY